MMPQRIILDTSAVNKLAKENSALASENEKLKAAKTSKTPPKKASKGKHKRRRTVSS